MSTFQGKLAIVTGASKANGVGFATALALAQEGADIVIHYNSNKDAALKNVETIKALGVKAIAVQADASSVTFGTTIVKATMEAFPGRTIDVLVNNAAALTAKPNLASFTVEDFETVFNVNVRSIFLLIQAAEPHFTAPGARIVNVSSVVARFGLAPGNFYAGSKASLHAMTRGWSEYFAPRGINVNVALLGPIETDLVFPEDNPYVSRFREDQHIKRNGTTKEVADAIVFLSGTGSSYITGQVLNIDGGMTYA